MNELGTTLQVACTGAPVHVKVRSPANPPCGVTQLEYWPFRRGKLSVSE
jgi:hypothetical protein